MDGNRFDALTQTLLRGESRRGFFRRLAGAAALVAGIRPLATGAACGPDQYAGSGGRCLCSVTGRPPGPLGCPCRSDAACPSGSICAGSACVCNGTVRLGGSPTDPAVGVNYDDFLALYLPGRIERHSAPDYGPFDLSLPFGTSFGVVATDDGQGQRGIGPLYLHCLATGRVQTLDTVGFPFQPSPGYAAPIYERDFTVQV